jgi:hypothetical protein
VMDMVEGRRGRGAAVVKGSGRGGGALVGRK